MYDEDDWSRSRPIQESHSRGLRRGRADGAGRGRSEEGKERKGKRRGKDSKRASGKSRTERGSALSWEEAVDVQRRVELKELEAQSKGEKDGGILMQKTGLLGVDGLVDFGVCEGAAPRRGSSAGLRIDV